MIGFGQIWEKELLKKNKEATFLEKKIAFDNYRNKHPNKKGYNPYARKMDFLETRLDEDGKYPAYKLFVELMKEKEKYSSSKNTSSANWQELGPFNTVPTLSGIDVGNGRINAIAFDPIDANNIWIGSGGGLWNSIDGGANWTTNTDDLPVIGISHIAINPDNPQIMYIGMGDYLDDYTQYIGILKSIDGGQSWDTTGYNFNIGGYYPTPKILINPNYTDSVFAATKNGVLLTIDGGDNWNLIYTTPSFYVVDLEFMPGNSNVIYAAIKDYSGSSSVCRSLDGGATWTVNTNGFLSDRTNIKIAVTNANPNVIYAVFTNSTQQYHGLYKSIDMGATWTLQSNTPNIISYQGMYNLSLAVDPTNEANVWVGGVLQWYSSDNGQSWVQEGGIHVDQHFADFNPLNNTLFVANDGGVYKYINNSFANISNDLRITQFYKLGLSTSNVNRLVGGTQDNGTQMLNNFSFHHISGGDGMECIIDPYNEDIIYSSSQWGYLRKSVDGGNSWIYITPASGSYPGSWVTPYKMHPLNNNMIVAGYKQIYRSLNGGNSWDSLSNPPLNHAYQRIDEIALAPSDVDYIYASSHYVDSLYVTKDGGTTWITYGLSAINNASITDIVVSPDDPEKIWITNNTTVYKSLDAGNSWVNISGNNLPNIPIHCIVYQDNAKNDLYVGTDLGVYHRDSTMSDWMPFMTGLPNVAVTELEIHYGIGKIRAATYGRGMWESNLNTPPVSVNFEEIASCTIYPNPTRDKINIEFSEFYDGDISVNIYNLTGEIVLTKTLKNKTILLDISFLKAGCYFININGKDRHKLIRKKIIKY